MRLDWESWAYFHTGNTAVSTTSFMQHKINARKSHTSQLCAVVFIPNPAPAPGSAAPAEGHGRSFLSLWSQEGHSDINIQGSCKYLKIIWATTIELLTEKLEKLFYCSCFEYFKWWLVLLEVCFWSGCLGFVAAVSNCIPFLSTQVCPETLRHERMAWQEAVWGGGSTKSYRTQSNPALQSCCRRGVRKRSQGDH